MDLSCPSFMSYIVHMSIRKRLIYCELENPLMQLLSAAEHSYVAFTSTTNSGSPLFVDLMIWWLIMPRAQKIEKAGCKSLLHLILVCSDLAVWHFHFHTSGIQKLDKLSNVALSFQDVPMELIYISIMPHYYLYGNGLQVPFLSLPNKHQGAIISLTPSLWRHLRCTSRIIGISEDLSEDSIILHS